MTEITYLDPRSGATYPLATPRWCGDGQAPLMLTPLPANKRKPRFLQETEDVEPEEENQAPGAGPT